MKQYEVRDMSLAPSGHMKIQWVRDNMPLLRGLEEEFLLEHADSCVRIPMRAEARSLNLSNSVAIAVYEGLRQNAFGSLERAGQLHRLHWE